MKKRKNRLKNGLLFWCAVYPVALIVATIICLLRLVGWLRVRGYEKMLIQKGPILLISNHPSLWEPIILAGLFFPKYLFHPVKNIPWSTPDKVNYADKWYLGIFNSRFIPVPRGSHREEHKSLAEIIKILRLGGHVVLFAEGGRTGKGDRLVYSKSGKRMRVLKNGVGRILCRSNCNVLPVWVDGAEKILPIGTSWPRIWRGMTVTFGHSFHQTRIRNARRNDFEKLTRFVSECLIETAG